VVGSPYRISPIFPVLPEESTDPDLGGASFLAFYSFDRAFSIIGRLLRQLPSGLLPNMWFSHGFASLVIFSKDRESLDFSRDEPGLGLRAQEVWELRDGVVGRQEFWVAPPANLEVFEVADFSALDSDLQRVLVEFRHCIYTALERAARYIPDYVASFRSLVETVNQIIEELLYISKKSEIRPRTCSAVFSDMLRNNDIERQRRINHRTDHIIQLNSALSYVISQSFAGTVPVLERECQIQSYSFLGVGGASLALFRLAEFVQEIFRHHPVDDAILQKYGHIEGVEIFPNIGDFVAAKWETEDLRIDSHLAGISSSELRPKLVFYSGRLGFKESEFSVTAALQVISGSGTARWSLMTLTHELMHAHVRALLSVIFKDSEEEFDKYYVDFKEYRENRERRWKLIESLRSIMLNYLLEKRVYESYARKIAEARKAGEGGSLPIPKFSLPGKEDLLRWMRESFRDLNEIMVHVCDYHYFYNTNDALYLGLLWESWATVPTVLAEIDHYVFRSIVAVATKETGAIHDRFHLAINILTQNLDALLERRPDSPVVKAALEFARNKSNHLLLSIKFYPALYLAEATLKFLVSRRIHVALMAGDENLELANGSYRYLVETGQFPGFDVKTPVGFLADRLRRSLGGEDLDLSEEHVSAWLLLACASTTPVGRAGK
jgi:predicted nuclease with RNAse H fold